MLDKLTVGIADMKAAKGSGEIVTYALGSCVGVSLYDSVTKIAALVHIMLPINMTVGKLTPLKYADTGIAQTLKHMEQMGADRTRIRAKIAGGAKMFDTGGNSAMSNIGQRNVDSVTLCLKKFGVMIVGQDVGGAHARTMICNVETGICNVRSYGKPEVTL